MYFFILPQKVQQVYLTGVTAVGIKMKVACVGMLDLRKTAIHALGKLGVWTPQYLLNVHDFELLFRFSLPSSYFLT